MTLNELASAHQQVRAEDLTNFVSKPDFNSWASLAPFVATLVGLGLALLAVVSLVVLLKNAFVLVMAGRDQDKTDMARRGIRNAGMGLIGSLLFVYFVSVVYPVLQKLSNR